MRRPFLVLVAVVAFAAGPRVAHADYCYASYSMVYSYIIALVGLNDAEGTPLQAVPDDLYIGIVLDGIRWQSFEGTATAWSATAPTEDDPLWWDFGGVGGSVAGFASVSGSAWCPDGGHSASGAQVSADGWVQNCTDQDYTVLIDVTLDVTGSTQVVNRDYAAAVGRAAFTWETGSGESNYDTAGLSLYSPPDASGHDLHVTHMEFVTPPDGSTMHFHGTVKVDGEAATPEPSSLVLMVSALPIGLAWLRRRRAA